LKARLFEALSLLGVFEIGVELVVVEVVAEVDVCVDWGFVLVNYLLQRVVALFVVVGNVVKLLFVCLDFVQIFHYFRKVETVLVCHFGFLFLHHFHRRNVHFFAVL
jgi:hypothetical protein